MATQGYGTAPGRNAANAVGTSKPRSESTKAVPIINNAMALAFAKARESANSSKGK